jgi:hypothetical protein
VNKVGVEVELGDQRVEEVCESVRVDFCFYLAEQGLPDRFLFCCGDRFNVEGGDVEVWKGLAAAEY